MLNKLVSAVLELVKETQDYRPVAYRVTVRVGGITLTHVPSGKSVKFNLF